MADYIDREKLLKQITEPMNWTDSEAELQEQADYQAFKNMVENAPVEDVVDIETLKKWLYKIAFNNVGCKLEGDFSDACEEIISRLDGLKRFVKETREDVVPRSEVEGYIKIMFEAELIKAKQEVAKQIFDMVKKRIHNEYNDLSNIVPTDDDYYLGKLAGISEAEIIIAELKKKYIGKDTDVPTNIGE